MRYPEELVEDVRRQNDIVDVISSYVKLKKTGSNYQGLCPFHNEKTPSFSVSQTKQIFKCFGCGKAGGVFTFVMEYENIDYKEAIKFLADRAGITLPEITEGDSEAALKRKKEKEQLLDIYKKAAVFYCKLLRTEQGRIGYSYFKNRALSDETIVKFGLGFSSPGSNKLYDYLKGEGYSDNILSKTKLFKYTEDRGAYDKFWNRVMFPIMDINGKVIAFGGRKMTSDDNVPKYINSDETDIFLKGNNLYAMNISRHSREDYFLLCEGYMDVIALHQAGFDNAIASLGTALTPMQARLISRYKKKAIITYDSDGAGRNAALRAIPILKREGVTLKVLNMSPYKDPDEFIKGLGREEYEKRIDEAKPAFYFELDCMEKDYDLEDPVQKGRLVNHLAAKMLEYPDEIERTAYMQAISKRYGFEYDTFKRRVNEIAAGTVKVEDYHAPETKERVNASNKLQGLDKKRWESEKLLLTWSIEDRKYSEALLEFAEPEDFQTGIPQEIAQLLFKQLKESEGNIIPATYVNRYETVEEQNLVSELFQSDIWNKTKADGDSREKAFADALKIVLTLSNQVKMNKASEDNDTAAFMKCMDRKKKLDKINTVIYSQLTR